MLKQLLKYEFKATGRIYGGLYLAILAVALLMGIFWRSEALDSSPMAFLLIVYIALGVALTVATLLSIVQRFTRNLLGREGYLMHTLPVTDGQLIFSKLISSMVWILCSIVILLASFALFGIFGLMNIPEAFSGWDAAELGRLGGLLRQFLSGYGAATIFMALECLVSLACSILCIYTACMIGHWSGKYMVPVGIAAFVVMNSVQNKLLDLLPWRHSGLNLVVTITTVAGDAGEYAYQLTGNKNYIWTVLATLAATLVLCAAYFAATRWLMKNKLNLE